MGFVIERWETVHSPLFLSVVGIRWPKPELTAHGKKSLTTSTKQSSVA